jgi:hypothetical protein
MRDAIGDEVNTTPAATSSDVPMRPVGFRPIAMLNRSALETPLRMVGVHGTSSNACLARFIEISTSPEASV